MTRIVNLPKPSDSLLSTVRAVALSNPVNYGSQRWHKTIQPEHVNCAAGEFFLDPAVSSLALAEYQPFFAEPILAVIGIIINTESFPATYPPHSDINRTLAINYYIDLGGHNVDTIFYKKTDSILDIGGHVLSYDTVPEIDHVDRFSTGLWYAMNPKQYHSVEGIESSRLMITLSFRGLTFDQFIAKYKQYL